MTSPPLPPSRITFLSWRDTGHPDGGGSELYVEEVARGLAAQGHDVTILCASYPGAARESHRDRVRILRRGGRLTVYLHGLLHVAARRSRRDLVVDVINGIPFGSPLVRRRGVVALVHHVHREQWRIIYPGLWGRVGWFVESRLTPLMYRSVPHVTVSRASRDDLVALGIAADRIAVVPNGTPVPAPEATAPAQGGGPEFAPRLCVLSRLVPHKQIEHAVDVLAELLPGCPGLHLDVIGEGWWHAHVVEHVAGRGVGHAVTMHGHVDEATKSALLERAHLMLLPSVKEGWGISVLEAASHGTPTVAYRHAGGVRESIEDGVSGILVDDVEGMRDATRALLSDSERRERLAVAGRTRAAGYTWASTVDGFAGVLAGAAVTGRR